MLDKYINYDKAIEGMLRAKNDNILTLESLESQLKEVNESIGNIPAIRYDKDPVQTSPTDDAMANMIIKKELLEEKIEELQKEINLIDSAWIHLTDVEQKILYEFFQAGYYRTEDAVDILCKTYCYDRRTIFRKRSECIKRLKRLMFG